MDEALKNLSDDPAELKNLIEKLVGDLNKKDEKILQQSQQITKKKDLIQKKQSTIEKLEEQLRSMQRQRFGTKSEKNPDQFELQLFNEAEVLLETAEPKIDSINVKSRRHGHCPRTCRVLT